LDSLWTEKKLVEFCKKLKEFEFIKTLQFNIGFKEDSTEFNEAEIVGILGEGVVSTCENAYRPNGRPQTKTPSRRRKIAKSGARS